MKEARFHKLYLQLRSKALDYATFRCNRREVAEDVVQDVFFKIWRRMDLMEEVNNQEAYIFIMIRNAMHNHLYKERRILLSDTVSAIAYPDATDLQQRFEEKEQRVRLALAMRQLAPKQQLVFKLKVEYNWKTKEIAAVLNLSKFTVKNHIRMAEKNVRQLMQMEVAA